MAPKQTRVVFTIAEKQGLRARNRECPSLTQVELMRWFEEVYRKPIKQSSISEILSKRNNELDTFEGPSSRKKTRQELYPDLEGALHSWVAQSQGKITITSDLIKLKALQYWHDLPQYRDRNLPAFSNG